MRNLILLIVITISTSVFSQEHDTILVAKRSNAISNWDFQLANFHYSKISKPVKDSLNLKRKWLSNFMIQPLIGSVNDFDISIPFVGFNFGFGLDPTARWQTQQQFNNRTFNVNDIDGGQSNYKLQNSFRANEKWEVKLNYQSMKLEGMRNTSFYGEDNLIEQEGFEFNITSSGKVERAISLTSLGLVKHEKNLKIGGFFGVSNETLTDSLIVHQTDSTEPVHSFEISSNKLNQLSLFGQWQPQAFNSNVKFTGWIDLPYNKENIGFSTFFQTEILLTPNTWVGGWVRDYTNELNPIELAADVQNFGLDRVYLKYGGTVNYQKTKRWWIEFNIELQKRRAYKSTINYSTLSLDFKFTYRFISLGN